MTARHSTRRLAQSCGGSWREYHQLMPRCFTFMALLAALSFSSMGAEVDLHFDRTAEFVALKKSDGQELMRYWVKKPEGSNLPVESAGFFHPLKTPAGVVVTDLAPGDHPHHRGVFLAWVEMHGAADADFWGWGEHAPIEGRRIMNRKGSGFRTSDDKASFTVENAWMAEDEMMLVERLQVAVQAGQKANLLDLNYRLTPSADTTLSQWAFSGFCARTVKTGTIEAFGPKGKIDLPNPVHTKPETDWPDAPWYAYALKFPDGKRVGLAVLNHPENPPTLWHNHRDTRMLNPCIVAPAEVQLQKHKPLNLRYRVVAFDGDPPVDLLNQLAADWSKLP